MLAPVGLDLIEELRLRRWARENYVAAEERDAAWHHVVLDEMTRKDAEQGLHGARHGDGAHLLAGPRSRANVAHAVSYN
jgi:hypothetical protein